MYIANFIFFSPFLLLSNLNEKIANLKALWKNVSVPFMKLNQCKINIAGCTVALGKHPSRKEGAHFEIVVIHTP